MADLRQADHGNGARYQRYALGTPRVTVSDLGGTTRSFDVPDGGDLAPRLAAAFDPSRARRTSFHAAFGLFHEYPLLIVAIVTEVHDGEELLLLRGFPASLRAGMAVSRSPAAAAGRVPEPGHHRRTGFPCAVRAHARARLRSRAAPGTQAGVDLLSVRGKRQIGPIDFNPIVPALGDGPAAERRRREERARRRASSAHELRRELVPGLTVSLHKRAARWSRRRRPTRSPRPRTSGATSSVPRTSPRTRVADVTRRIPKGSRRLRSQRVSRSGWRGPAAPARVERRGGAALALRLSGIATSLRAALHGAGGVRPQRRRLPARTTGRAAALPTRRAAWAAMPRATPGFAAVDARLARRFALSGRVALELLAEAFNLLDRANFSDVNNVFGRGSVPGQSAARPAGPRDVRAATRRPMPRGRCSSRRRLSSARESRASPPTRASPRNI